MFSPESSLYLKCTRHQKRTIHWLLMGLGNLCATVGIAAIYANKNARGVSHFQSWHGFMGIITYVYGLVQSVGGSSLMLGYPLPGVTFGRQKAYHATSGMLLFFLMCMSLWLSMWSNWFTSEVTGTSWYACMACPMVMSLVIMTQVTRAYLPPSQRPQYHT